MSRRELFSEVEVIDHFESYYCETVKVHQSGCLLKFSTEKEDEIGCLFPKGVRIGEGLPDLATFTSALNVKDFLKSLSSTHTLTASVRRIDVPVTCQGSSDQVFTCFWLAESLTIGTKKPSRIVEGTFNGVLARVRKIDWELAVAALEVTEPVFLKKKVIFLSLDVLSINGQKFKKGTNSSIFFDQEILCEVQTLPTNDFSSSDLGFEFDLFATNACLYEKHLLKQEPEVSNSLIKTKDAPNTFLGKIEFLVHNLDFGSSGWIKIMKSKFGPGHETKVWFSSQVVYKNGISLENANLVKELCIGDPVMVYFDRFKAASHKVQTAFKVYLEAILVTIGEPNCSNTTFYDITKGNIKMDSSALNHKHNRIGSASNVSPSAELISDEEKLLKRIASKLGHSPNINLVDDDSGFSAGLKIISMLSYELKDYCLTKERKSIGRVFSKHKTMMEPVNKLLGVLSKSIEDSPSSNSRLPSPCSSTENISKNHFLHKEKEKSFPETTFEENFHRHSGIKESSQRPSTMAPSRDYEKYRTVHRNYDERKSTTVDDIYNKGLDVENFLISLDRTQTEKPSTSQIRESQGPTDLYYSQHKVEKLHSDSERKRWSTDEFESTWDRRVDRSHYPTSDMFEKRGSGSQSPQRSPIFKKKYVENASKGYGFESERDLNYPEPTSALGKRLKFDPFGYDDDPRPSFKKWEEDDAARHRFF